MRFLENRPMLRFVLVSGILAALWIFLSDWVVARLFPESAENLLAQSIKGLLFVLVFGSLVYLVLQREFNRAQEAYRTLRRSEERLKRAEEASFVMTSHVSLEGRWLRAPGGLSVLLGCAEGSLQERPIRDVCHPDDWPGLWKEFEDLIDGAKDSFEREVRFTGREEKTVWLYLNASAVRDEEGRPLHFIVYLRDTTARKRAETERDRLVDILEATPDFVGTCKPDRRVLYLNRAARALVERAGRPIQEMRVSDCHPDWAVEIIEREGIPAAMQSGYWQGEAAILTAGGVEIPVLEVIIAHRDGEGRLQYLSTVAHDISERKRNEAALRTSEERSQILALATNDAVWDWNLLDDHVTWNDGIQTLFGYDPGEVGSDAQWWVDRIHADEREGVDTDIHRLIDSDKRFWSGEYRFRRGDGSYADVYDRGYVMRDEAGRPTRMIGAMMDISELKQTERALRESEARLKLAVSAANIGLWDWDTRTTTIYFSPEWKRQLGYEDHEIEGDLEEWRSRVHPDDLEAAEARVQSFLEQPWPNYFNEFRMKHRDGTYRWILANADLLPGEDGNLTRMVGSHIDITEQKLEEERILSIARAVSAVPGTDFFPHFAEQMARALRADGALVGELTDESNEIRTLAVWRKGEAEQNFTYPLNGTPCENVVAGELCLHSSGVRARFPQDRLLEAWKSEAYAGVPLRDAMGETCGLLAVLFERPLEQTKIVESMLRILATRASGELQRSRDLEVHRQLEAQMRHTQKLESLGVLAGGIAHDFNNLLLAIMGNTGLARLEAQSLPKLQPLLNDIEQAAERAAELCRQLLAYSGKGKFVVRPIDLNELIQELNPLFKVSVSRKAELKIEPAPALPAIEGDPSQIRQVLMNLVINASDSLEDRSGTIAIRTSARYCLREYLDENLDGRDLPEGRYVVLEVEDDGCGMEPEVVERIFDPFFTTKFTGRGLGMAAVLGIIRGHHGVIHVESRCGGGSKFELLFPAVESAVGGAVRESRPSAVDWAGEGTILIADDEPAVRDFTQRVLERAGYRVVTANDGGEAIDQAQTHRDDLVLALLDLTMPQISGAEASLQIRSHLPGLPILLTSGYSEEEVADQLPDVEPVNFIQKPYHPEDLIEQVRRLVTHEASP